MNAGNLAIENIERFGEYPILHWRGTTISNVELDAKARRLASVLRQRGIGIGDRVAVVMPNCPEVFEAFQAVWKIGAVILPVRPQLAVPEIQHMLRDSGASAVISTVELVPLIRQACPELPLLLTLGGQSVEGAVALAAETAGAEPLAEMTHRSGHDLALLLYTSGTTGRPKGVMLTHDSVAAVPHPKMVDLPPFMPTLHALPLSHSFGVLMMNLGFIKGMQAKLLVHWDTRLVFEAIQELRVMRFSMVPTMLTYMLEFPDRDRYDTSSLESVWTGGAPLPDAVRREFEEVFACRIRDGYGMTESGGAGAAYYDEDVFRPGSVGRAQPDTSIRVVDENGADVAAGTQGEILIGGPTLMAGYWRNQKATEEALMDGWLYSGDIGYLDEDGYLYITDRKKDLIIKGGENISPREIEEALYAHEAVAEAVVFGVPDARFGENLWAAVAPSGDVEVREEDLLRHVATRVTRFKVPARIFVLDEIPKNATGKLQKRAVRDRLLAGDGTA
ncbi:MAG: AMP-binding protein [Acidobacteria bacterium]|nr:AMP-binding protein [Acidobacteriota bacterium]